MRIIKIDFKRISNKLVVKARLIIFLYICFLLIMNCVNHYYLVIWLNVFFASMHLIISVTVIFELVFCVIMTSSFHQNYAKVSCVIITSSFYSNYSELHSNHSEFFLLSHQLFVLIKMIFLYQMNFLIQMKINTNLLSERFLKHYQMLFFLRISARTVLLVYS